MKSHLRSKGSSLSARLRGPHAAGRVLGSIKNIMGELEDLQAEIYGRMGGPGEMLEGCSRRERESAERTLSDFKLALDQLRYVLWLSLEQQAGGLRETDSPLALAKTSLRPDKASLTPARSTPSAEAATSASFFDRLDVVIEAYMNKNTLAGSASRKRLKT